MRLPRNPFRSSKVESLESDDLFLKLFQPLALGALGESPWEAVQLIRSAQGGGKTSLLRIFTPGCLRRVMLPGSSGYLSEIADALKAVNALGEDGPNVLGLYLPFASTPYASIARMNLGDQNPLHLFYALLDARIVITALRGALALKGIVYDGNFDRITFSWPVADANPLCQFENSQSLYEWAKDTEKDIWRAIDQGKPKSVMHMGHAKPYALEAFSKDAIRMNGSPICQRVLIMADDIHKLASEQRKQLLEHVIPSRLNVSFWAAERMYAMEPYELLAPDTSSSGREHNDIVLSMWWQKATDINSSKFYNELANKRMQEVSIDAPFDQIAITNMDKPSEETKFRQVYTSIVERIKTAQADDPRLSAIQTPVPEFRVSIDELIQLKAIELYIARSLSKAQAVLDIEGAVLTPSSEDISELRAAAEYQVCTQNSLPLYYGAQTIYKLASWNVDQFLSIAGGLFDQLDVQRVRGVEQIISPTAQDKIMRELASEYWAGIPKRMPKGELMQRFLRGFAKYATETSLSPTAKYPPGVTGFGITSREHDRLRNCTRDADPNLYDLAELWSSAVAHNVIFMKANARQGKKGETVTVFYLNRLLCVYLGLPVGLGGWWKRKVDHFATLLQTEKMPNYDNSHPSPNRSTPNLFEGVENR